MATTTRVFRMDRGLADRFRAKRDQQDINTRTFMDNAVAQHLGGIEEKLLSIGLGDASQGSFPVKTEIDLASILSLNEASDATGVPAIYLLRLCLTHSVAEQPKSKKRPAKRTSKRAPSRKGGPK
jgi:hypothetical protein